MSSPSPVVDRGALAFLTSKRPVQIIAATVTAGLVAGVVATSGGSAAGAATTTYSTGATGRFLSGTIAGTSLDTVAGIEGESAANKFGPTVTNKNSLNAELLNGAIKIPLANGLQLPGLNVLQLGAVAQYAQATPTGAALGASGAVDSNGGIGAGGSDGVPTGGATLDLSGLGGAALASLLNVKATIGAVSARAVQAPAKGSRTAPNTCPGGPGAKTISDGAQLGQYCVAGLRLEVDVPALSGLLNTAFATIEPLLTTLSNAVSLIPGGAITIPPLGDLVDSLSSVSIPTSGPGAGAISLNLKTGAIVIDVEKILEAAGLALNNLPPNTSLVPYIVKALAGLPAALSGIVDGLGKKITDYLGGIKITGVDSTIVGTLLSTLTSGLGTALAPVTTVLNTVVGQLTPITDLLAKLLEIIVNGQSTSDKIFTETALQLQIGDGLGLNSTIAPIIATLGNALGGGGALPIPVATNVRKSVVSTQTKIKAEAKKAQTNAKSAAPSSSAPSASKSPSSTHQVKLVSSIRPLVKANSSRIFALAPSDALVGLNLAQASVGPSTPRTITPTPTTAVPTTSVPTGVPAGQGAGGDSPTTPLVLVLLALALAAGGVVTYRFRGRRAMH